MMRRLPCLLAILLTTSLALAQETIQEPPDAPVPTTKPAAAPSPWERQFLTGDWGGARTELAEKGLTFNLNITQILQGNAHGGHRTRDGIKYSGSGDLTITADTGKLGLWEGGLLLLNAEPKWGDGINEMVGSLLPVNTDAARPGFNEGCTMTLSEWIYFQHLLENKLILIAGKLDGARAFDRNVFANDERTQFMNAALRNNMIIPAFLPYTNLGAGAVVNPTDWLSIITAVADTDGRNKTTGFETTFHGPTNTTVIHEWSFKIKPFDLPGNQRFGFVWSSKDFEHLQPPSPFKETGPLMMSLLGPNLANKVVRMLTKFDTSPDNVGLYYNFDQYLYTEEGCPDQGVGLFGRFGWARGDVNALEYFYSIGMGGKGVLPDRDEDTFGIGYFHANLSDDLPSFLQQEAGVEMYYNIQICPWLHISPDVQVIMDPGGFSNECSLVYGIRMQLNL
jgi:porin